MKLKAFTLMELLIGMIISSLVIGFCYGAYVLISKQYLVYKKVKVELVESAQFTTALMNDFNSAETIHYMDNKLVFQNKSVENKLEYIFDEMYVLRKVNEVQDTFKLKPQNMQVDYVLQDAVQGNEIVKSFSFEADVLEVKENFTFTKNYSAETLLRMIAIEQN